jgi:pyruvate formate lyase activating enzyme
MHPASFQHRLGNGQVECRLCNHYCRLNQGETGLCRVRRNLDGSLIALSYGQVAAIVAAPMENKYLFHFLPGTTTLSPAMAGCNFHCGFCINWRLSQGPIPGSQQNLSPRQVVDLALEKGAHSIAFTYTEPTISLEYARDIAQLAHQANLTVTAKSNGYMGREVLEDMSTWIDAINVDLRSSSSEAHARVIGTRLEPIMTNLKTMRQLGLWLEITTLIIPEFNDGHQQLEDTARFIAQELGRDTPWHLLRFYPANKMLDRSPTSQATLQLAVGIGKSAGLEYVYNKDVYRGAMLNTLCPQCRLLVLERNGLKLEKNHLIGGCCPNCGYRLPGVWHITPTTHSTAHPNREAVQDVR